MLDRRTFAKFAGATALSGLAAPALISRSFGTGRGARPSLRGNYLIKNGAVITVDPALGVLPRADVHVRDGRIEAVGPDLAAAGAEVIDATDMIVMPGFVDTHYHMWSALGRNFVGDGGFGYFPAKNATSKLYTRRGLLQQRDARSGGAGQRRHHHRAQLVAQHAHARACRRRTARAPRIDAARPLCLRPHRPDAAQRAARTYTDIDRVKREYFADGSAFDGLVTFGVNLRGLSQSDEPTYQRGHEGGDGARPEGGDPRRPVARPTRSTPRTTKSAAGSAPTS